MRILFDHGVPAPLLRFLPGHIVEKAKDRGWDTLSNGDLLTAAEAAGFELLVTADKNIRYQPRLAGRRIAIVVLGKSAMTGCEAACGESGCGRECGCTGELRRGRNSGIADLWFWFAASSTQCRIATF